MAAKTITPALTLSPQAMLSTPNTITVLNHLLSILSRSFPQYLAYARPYIPPSSQRFVETLDDITADQNGLIKRICQLIYESGALPDEGEFPMEFTDAHDLGIEYLVRQAVDYGRQDLADIEQCAESPNLTPAAKSLAEEAVGMTKGHLESLQDLV